MITDDRETVERRVSQVLARIDCRPYRVSHLHLESSLSVILFAQVDGEPESEGYPIKLNSLEPVDIVTAAFRAVVNSSQARIGEAFEYRGRPVLAGCMGLESRVDLAEVIERTDREVLLNAPRTFAVSSRGEATLL